MIHCVAYSLLLSFVCVFFQKVAKSLHSLKELFIFIKHGYLSHAVFYLMSYSYGIWFYNTPVFTEGWLPWAMEMWNQPGLLMFINLVFSSPLQIGQKLYFYCDKKWNTGEIFCFYLVFTGYVEAQIRSLPFFLIKKSWKHFKKAFLKIWRLYKHLVIHKKPHLTHPRGSVVLSEYALAVCSCSLRILVRHLCMTATSYSRYNLFISLTCSL